MQFASQHAESNPVCGDVRYIFGTSAISLILICVCDETGMYIEAKRCVPQGRQLHLQRCDPDPGFEQGSAVWVDTGRGLVKVTWSMLRKVVSTCEQTVVKALDDLKLPGKVLC